MPWQGLEGLDAISHPSGVAAHARGGAVVDGNEDGGLAFLRRHGADGFGAPHDVGLVDGNRAVVGPSTRRARFLASSPG